MPIRIYGSSTWLKTVQINQQTNGGRWNFLGTLTSKNKQLKVMVFLESVNYSPQAETMRCVTITDITMYIDNGWMGTAASCWCETSGGAIP